MKGWLLWLGILALVLITAESLRENGGNVAQTAVGMVYLLLFVALVYRVVSWLRRRHAR
jgi:prepilin signal peptidase PulO-like enzyme (type II secretory pathway)